LAYFRQTPAENYTKPTGNAAYQRWWEKWAPTSPPEWKEEYNRSVDPRTPVLRKEHFQTGVTLPPYREKMEKPAWRQEFRRQGVPETEATRAFALNRTHSYTANKNLYPFSIAITLTQYKKPVTAVYGPLLREEVYGVKTQLNRHGFMPCKDYYF